MKVITHQLVPKLRVKLYLYSPNTPSKRGQGLLFSRLRIYSEKRQLASSCLSVYRINQRGSHTGRISCNVISGTLTKVCRANTDVVKIEQKYWALYIFNIADSDMYSPTAVLPWLRERATVLLPALLPSS